MAGSDGQRWCVREGRGRFGDRSPVHSLHPGVQSDGVRGDSMTPDDGEPSGREQERGSDRFFQAGSSYGRMPRGTANGLDCLRCLCGRSRSTRRGGGRPQSHDEPVHRPLPITGPLDAPCCGESSGCLRAEGAGSPCEPRRMLGPAPTCRRRWCRERHVPRRVLLRGGQNPCANQVGRQWWRHCGEPTGSGRLLPVSRALRQQTLHMAGPVVDENQDVGEGDGMDVPGGVSERRNVSHDTVPQAWRSTRAQVLERAPSARPRR